MFKTQIWSLDGPENICKQIKFDLDYIYIKVFNQRTQNLNVSLPIATLGLRSRRVIECSCAMGLSLFNETI